MNEYVMELHLTFADASVDVYKNVCLGSLEKFIGESFDPMAWDGGKKVPRMCKQVVEVMLPWRVLVANNVGYIPDTYIDFLKDNGFENLDGHNYVVDITAGFNDLWWISHVCVLRYTWESPELLRVWEKICKEHPKWNKWAAFILVHQGIGPEYAYYYNAGHSLMSNAVNVMKPPREVLAALKAQPCPLMGNAYGIHSTWMGTDYVARNKDWSLEYRYQQLTGEAP